MANFGSYESVREFYRKGFKLVATARAVGRTTEEFAVKQWQSLAALSDPRHLQSEQQAFLEAAQVQKKAAETGKFWAKIHLAQKTDQGAYYVTDYYPRSLEQPIQGRVELKALALYTILTAIVQGLIELQTSCNRSHGNLKSSNVLLGDESDPAHLRVILTDPLPAARLDARQGKIDDFHALGNLIHQLVLHRPFHAMGGYPLPAGPEWRRLGKKSQAWIDLCNRLLNPHLNPDAVTLADLAQQLAELQPPPKNLTRWGIIAGTMLLIAVGAVVGWRIFKPQPPAPLKNIELPQWQTLCRDFENWLCFFYYPDSLATMLGADDIQVLRRDEYLAENLFNISQRAAQQDIELDPLVIAQRSGYTYQWLSQQDLAVILDENKSGRAYNAFGFIKEIKDALRLSQTGGGGYLSAWTTLNNICRAEKDFQDRNWNAHKEVQQALERISPLLRESDAQASQRPGALLLTLVYVVKEAQKVNDVQQRWERIRPPPPELLTADQAQNLQNLHQEIRQAEIIVLADKIADLQRYLIGITEQPADWHQAVTGYTFASLTLNQEWINRRDSLLQNATAQKLADKNNYDLYLNLREKVNNVREFLEQLNDDEQLPPGVADYFARYAAKPWFDQDFWKNTLNARREQTLKQLLTQVAWENDVPQLDFAQFRQGEDFGTIAAEYQLYYEQVRDLTAAFSRIEEGLDLAYALEEATAPDAPSIAELFGAHTEQPFQPIYRAFQNKLAPITQRIEQMHKVDSGLDKAILLNQALQADQVELARASWRKLRENPQWPLPEERPGRLEILAALDKRYRIFENEHPDRWQQLQAELTRAAASDSAKIIARGRRQIEPQLINARAAIEPPIDNLGDAFLAALDARIDQLQQIDRWDDPQFNQIEQAADRIQRYVADSWPRLIKNIAASARAYNELPNPAGYQKIDLAAKLRQAEDQLARLDRNQLFQLLDPESQELPAHPYELLNNELQTELQTLAAVVRLEEAITNLARIIAQTPDPVLARFNELLAAETQNLENLPDRQTKLEVLEPLAQKLALFVADDWQNKVNRDAFARRQNPISLAADKPPTVEIYENWLKEVPPYYWLETDPRSAWPDMIATIEEAKGDITPLPDRDQFAQKWLQDLPVILAAREIPGIEKNRTQIEQADVLLRQDHNKIRPGPEVLQAFAQAVNSAENVPDMFRQTIWPGVQESTKDIPEDSTFWALRDKVAKFREQLQLLADQFQPLPLPTAEGPTWVNELTRAQKNDYALAIQSLVDLVLKSGDIPAGAYPDLEDQGFQNQKEDVLNHYLPWRELPQVVEDLTELEGFLNRGYTLADELSGDRKIEKLLHQLNEVALFTRLSQTENPILPRVNRLRSLPAASERNQLTSSVHALAENENPEIVVSLWARLGELNDWPQNLLELEREHNLRQALTQIASRITAADPEHAQILLNQLNEQGPRRWAICLQQFTAPEDREKVFDLRTDFQVDITQLAQPLQEQLYRHELRRWLNQKEDFADDNDAARQQVNSYIQQNIANDQIAAEFSRLADQAWDQAGGPAPPTQVNVGPLASPMHDKGFPWRQKEAGPDDQWITYTLTWQSYQGPQTHELTFIRVEPEAADAGYLCTAEVSLGLFIDVIQAALRAKISIPPLADMLTEESAQEWPGPRLWNLTGNRIIPLTPNTTWVRPGRELLEGGQGDRNYYPADIAPPEITREHPIQHIPAETALFVARLLGCRLPTSAEWNAAYSVYEQQIPLENWNLRDQTWQKQNQRIMDALAQGFAYEVWPDEGVFWPLGTEPKDRLEKKDAQSLTHNDNTLWFDLVNPPVESRGNIFKHLVGNVAEFVYDQPQRFEEDLPAETMPAFEDIKNTLYDNPDSLYVIGGSALSPPQTLENLQQKEKADYSTGYSDVGFRLAFTTPRQSLPKILLGLLEPQ